MLEKRLELYSAGRCVYSTIANSKYIIIIIHNNNEIRIMDVNNCNHLCGDFHYLNKICSIAHHFSLCVVCVRVYVVYEDTNLYNNMGMTEVLQFEGVL